MILIKPQVMYHLQILEVGAQRVLRFEPCFWHFDQTGQFPDSGCTGLYPTIRRVGFGLHFFHL